jgi:hypothetical protein
VRELHEAVIWQLGIDHVEPTRGKPVLARADISVGNIEDVGKELGFSLRLDANDDPPRHAAIVGWPEKSLAKALCLELAARARLVARPGAAA